MTVNIALAICLVVELVVWCAYLVTDREAIEKEKDSWHAEAVKAREAEPPEDLG